MNPQGLTSSKAVLRAGLRPTTSIPHQRFGHPSRPSPFAPSPLSILKLSGSAPRSLANARRLSTLSIAKSYFGLCSRVATMAQSPTGPHPITTTVTPEILCACSVLKALVAPKKPVGHISAIKTSALSDIVSRAFMTYHLREEFAHIPLGRHQAVPSRRERN
jgi:hypothetical protein